MSDKNNKETNREIIDILGCNISIDTLLVDNFIFKDTNLSNFNKIFETAKLVSISNNSIVNKDDFESGRIKIFFLEWLSMEISCKLQEAYDKIASRGIEKVDEYRNIIQRYTNPILNISKFYNKIINSISIKPRQRIAVSWEVSGYIDIEANSLKEAMDKFNQDPDIYNLPYDGEYVDGSFKLTTEDENEMKEIIQI